MKIEPWSGEKHLNDPVVPSYEGWIKIKNLPLNRWDIETLKHMGDACGGFVEMAKKTSSRIDLMEATVMKAKVSIPSPSSKIPLMVIILTEPCFNEEPFVDVMLGY